MNNKSNGFTLIEAVAAFVLVSFIAIAGFSFYPYYKKSLLRAEIKFTAVNFARETLELLSWQTTTLPVTNGEVDNPLPSDSGLMKKVSNAKRTYSVKMDPTGNYKIITATVSWDY